LNIEKAKEIILTLLEKKGVTVNMNAIDMKDKIERVKQFTEKNYDKKISLEDVAELVFLSPKYFSRIFKEVTGIGFNDYKLEVKINRAKEMLENSGFNVDEIAYKIGYENPESFIRIFKKNTSHTPTEYREKIRKDNFNSSIQ
jgi:two-component system, response regulator YesN